MLAAEEVVKDRRAVGKDQQVARRRSRRPNRHVAGAGGIENVDRIDDHRNGDTVRAHDLLEAAATGKIERMVYGVRVAVVIRRAVAIVWQRGPPLERPADGGRSLR